jgi:beta-alanine--pyruvate transaminase
MYRRESPANLDVLVFFHKLEQTRSNYCTKTLMNPDSASDLSAFWMPFTANRQYKAEPRMLVSAEGLYYHSEEGCAILDGTSGLWCVNAGHGRSQISEAVSAQINQLDFAPAFQMGHPLPFELAQRLAKLSPPGLDKVFFTNSGSESVDTALKIALAYHQAHGHHSKTRLIGREKGYHGTGFGGISVGGLVNNRRGFGPLLPGVDHLKNAWLPGSEFTRGLPERGAELADELLELIGRHGAETIAAVIVEPLACSGGVWVPPQGYLQRLREITQAHDILLIFDEVITGFGRVGTPFAATRFDVTPDILTVAKGITNGAIPMGAVVVQNAIHDAFMQGPPEVVELFHGYTYSGHPVAAAAALATLDIYEQENLFEKALQLEDYWADSIHSLREFNVVKDIRNLGLVGAVELHPGAKPGERGYRVFHHAYWKQNALLRCTADIIAMSPPLIIEKAEIDQLIGALRESIKSLY